MQTPPHAPFLSLRPGFPEEGSCFPDEPAEGVRNFARSLAGTARLARVLAEAGERIDLAGLTSHVGRLCAKALDLAPEQGREMRAELTALRGDLDALAHVLGCRRPVPDPRSRLHFGKRPRMLSSSASLLTALAALAAVLALIWLAGRAARFAGLARRPAASGRLLSVEDVVALDARRRLHVVRCADRHVVLLTGPGQDLVVGWIDSPVPERRS